MRKGVKDKRIPFSIVRAKWRQCASRLRNSFSEDVHIEERVENTCHSKTIELLKIVISSENGGKKSKRNKRKNKKTRKSTK
jgi:hypothetical protein